ncbi:MAG: hypothetical protein LBC63_03910 [Holophagales bacterium]|jgi:hypothetical protein|nr:hypothetical protein [Holophagales bacterium]
MKPIQAAIISLCFLMAAPAFGQSDRIKAELRGNGAMLVYFGDDDTAAAKMRAILRSDELIDLGLRQLALAPQSKDATEIKQQLKMTLGSNWALVDSNGFAIVQGGALPSAEAISAALQKAGLRSPIKVLREFLKQHPGHLSARIDLLTRLRVIAEKRTIRTLKLNAITADELPPGQHAITEYTYTWLNINSEIAKYADKTLAAKDDIEIWGGYAQEMDLVFNTGEWRMIRNFIRPERQIPLEACSRIMAGLYRLHLPKVAEALRERPSYEYLWQTYAWMRGIARDKSSIQALLATLPAESYFAREMLGKEDRENNRWGSLAERLWARRKSMLASQYSIHSQLTASSKMIAVADLKKRAENESGEMLEMLEALIRTSRAGDAEYVVKTFAKFPHNPNFTQKAADLAIKCGRQDLATKWRDMQIEATPGKNDVEYLEAILPRDNFPLVVLVNGEVEPLHPLLASLGIVAMENKQLSQLLKSKELVEWQLEGAALNKELSALMQQREGWFGSETRWAMLMDTDGELKVTSSGLGMPSVKDLVAALEHARAEKPVDRLKRAFKETPNYYGALEELVPILLDAATAKTEAKIAQTKASELSDDDDALIWGEYAQYYRKLIDFLANNFWLYIHWEPIHIDTYETLKYSPTMKALCKELLPLASAKVQKLPSDEDYYWDLWIMLFDPSRDTQFSDFLDSIVQSPLQEKYSNLSRMDVGVALRMQAAEKYKLNENWSGVVNALEPFWEGLRSRGELGNLNFHLGNSYSWSGSTLPLIEAYLNLGRDAALKEWVAVWKESPRWKNIEAEVTKLYEKYGR